ncbi:ComC/BlpC family leader-containing pheromone/bacteriocin [Clostridium gasigenes]|uniref:ComC/BlpC family leader-containing pheromone/bacteriocin n=1 Tax=Clostridium gasigenes TaxID=94869 RepID=UPI003BFA6A8F
MSIYNFILCFILKIITIQVKGCFFMKLLSINNFQTLKIDQLENINGGVAIPVVRFVKFFMNLL